MVIYKEDLRQRTNCTILYLFRYTHALLDSQVHHSKLSTLFQTHIHIHIQLFLKIQKLLLTWVSKSIEVFHKFTNTLLLAKSLPKCPRADGAGALMFGGDGAPVSVMAVVAQLLCLQHLLWGAHCPLRRWGTPPLYLLDSSHIID